MELKVCGYADDTALYVAERNNVTHALAELARFSEASELEVNHTKSVAVPVTWHHGRLSMETDEPESTRRALAELEGIPVLGDTASCRYFGIRVGLGDVQSEEWEKCIDALRVWLTLATEKMH
ncbi:hypothetical protein PybrP1_006591, partial [[Pythium] brassicae (nom. inval.)]